MTDAQLLWRVEMPLAMSTILAGIRVATVIAVGVATIAAAIGAGGLGEFVFRGVAMVDNQFIMAGAIPAAILALTADFAGHEVFYIVAPDTRMARPSLELKQRFFPENLEIIQLPADNI